MDNNSANILEQLRQRIEDLQTELDSLKSDYEAFKASALQSEDRSEGFSEPVDLSFEDIPDSFEDTPVESEPVQQTENTQSASDPAQQNEDQPVSELVQQNEVQPASEPVMQKIEEQSQPKPTRPAVAWRVDIPGAPVSNIISGISLNDRVLFINTLFKEDPMLFQSTINVFNSLPNLDAAVDYVMSNFPDWNINSDIVYRLMMAVRRKLR